MKNARIILFTLVIEGILVGAFLLWASWRQVAFPGVVTRAHLISGALAALPLLAFNFLLFSEMANRLPQLEPCRAFRDQILVPLAKELSLVGALIVSCAAGVGEELFFRYFLQTEVGIIFSSLLFAVLHFGPVVKDYCFIASLYFGYGVYFGAVFSFSENIWVPIVAHSLYDFAALIYLRSRRVTA